MPRPVRPEDVLPDGDDRATIGGVDVRKGSVAAFVANAQRLAQVPPDSPEGVDIVAQLRALAPTLRAVGVFDVFTPRTDQIAAIVAGA